jgi:hypothetical protein
MYLATNEQTRNDLLIMILWGLLLVPKNYYIISGEQNIGMIINPLILVGLLILFVCSRTTKLVLGNESPEDPLESKHPEAPCPTQAAT